MPDLMDTVDMMASSDYKERFKAEYYQLAIRLRRLKNVIEKINRGEFQPTCSKGILADQVYLMEQYLDLLKSRADIEGIKVDL